MAKITHEMTVMAYKIGKQVYEKSLSVQKGVAIITQKTGMNCASAKYYITVYQYMRDGLVYRRTINQHSTEYFLAQIYQEHGTNALNQALKALNGHMVYYESLGHGRLDGLHDVYEDYKKNTESVEI